MDRFTWNLLVMRGGSDQSTIRRYSDTTYYRVLDMKCTLWCGLSKFKNRDRSIIHAKDQVQSIGRERPKV